MMHIHAHTFILSHTRLVNNENASQTYPFWLITNHNLLILLKHFVQRTENNRLTDSFHIHEYRSSSSIFQLFAHLACVCVSMSVREFIANRVQKR